MQGYAALRAFCGMQNMNHISDEGDQSLIDEMLLRMACGLVTVGRSVCQVFPLETPSFPHID